MRFTLSPSIIRNIVPLLFLNSANVIADANCPSSESGDVDAVITDHIFISSDNEAPENSCLSSNTITVGGVPSKWVVIQQGAEVYLIASGGIGFDSNVLVVQGGVLHAALTSMPTTDQGKLNDTGITTCSNESTDSLPCPQASYPGQDAEYGRDATHNDDADGHAGFSFTKLGSECVKDNVTGLTWEVKTDDGGLRDKDNTYTWYNLDSSNNGGSAGTQNGGSCIGSDCDTQGYVQAVNAQGLCGAKDWRMPTIKELENIASQDRYSPTIDTDYFPNTISSNYWSGSPAAHDSGHAWYVNFSYGSSSYHHKSYDTYVRLVRGGQ